MWQVIGQTRMVSLLQHSLEAKKLAHAYLVVGPPHIGKMTLSINLAQALNCQASERPCLECVSCQKIATASHADVQVIGLTQNEDATEAKLIGIDQIKEVQHTASLPPFEGKHKVFIIDGAELLSMEAANCLLKTLEEPSDKVTFILLTTNDKLLPETVVSRCQRLDLSPLSMAEVESALTNSLSIEPERARLLASLAHGCPGWAFSAVADDSLLQQRDEDMKRLLDVITSDYEESFAFVAQLAAQFSQNRGTVFRVLDLWLDFWRDLMLVKLDCYDIITNVDQRGKLAEIGGGYRLSQIKSFVESIQAAIEQLHQNANPRLVLEVLMLDIPRKEGEEDLADQSLVKYG